MAATTPSDPDPADQDQLSDAVDEMEERVVGRRVDPPRSDELGDPEDAEARDGTTPGDEPS
ncbi:hypothetical protein [Pseudonocardia humida]|uniref:Autophagy-related protein 2 n=1 Tax=Pseudonocardia humida TaxID=2800819 RepID=A0ABT0ZTQ8_9PSEU|nr:hypothetical protein [Pseudonocardia humida]MCO1654116.1 hypothetical protein [Pseudonocardia humida]